MKKLLVSALALVSLVAAGMAITRLKEPRAAAAPRSPRLEVPGPVTVPRPAFQRGVQLDTYINPGQDVTAVAATDIAYIKSLHANAVMISFPYFVAGRRSSTVFTTSRTPTPAQLAIIITRAEHTGLYVAIRPLLDEKALGESRVHWAPPNLGTWFASYKSFLKPYAQMAQRDHVGEFVVGAEFSRFNNSPDWNALDRSLRTWYRGTLAYANNAKVNLTNASGGRVALKTTDIYPSLAPPFPAKWVRFDRTLPPGTVASEVGIAAVPGAWRKPWVHDWPATHLDPQLQARWFSAACHAAIVTHMHGIYFWTLPFSATLHGPTLTRQIDWAHAPGATAISGCYAAEARATR